MGGMKEFGVFLWNAAITLFAFFAVAPIVLSAVSMFGVQKRFSQTMIDEGGVIISVIVVAALAYTCVKMLPYGPICALFGLVAGVMKYRKVTQFNSLTVQRFKNTYKDCYDAKKLNAYVDKMF